MEVKDDKCCFGKCRSPSSLYYFGKPLCDKCWNKLCELPTNEMKDLLKVRYKKPKITPQSAVEPEVIVAEQQAPVEPVRVESSE